MVFIIGQECLFFLFFYEYNDFIYFLWRSFSERWNYHVQWVIKHHEFDNKIHIKSWFILMIANATVVKILPLEKDAV